MITEVVTIEDFNLLKEFDKKIIYDKDKSNPFVISFIEDKEFINEAQNNEHPYKFFLYHDSNGDLAGRCAINLSLFDWDICAYGEEATKLFNNYSLGGCIGDLVDPNYRGLGIQKRMIAFKLEYLENLNKFDYALVGMLSNNTISINNYKSFGFTEVGRKIRIWENDKDREDTVILFKKKLNKQ